MIRTSTTKAHTARESRFVCWPLGRRRLSQALHASLVSLLSLGFGLPHVSGEEEVNAQADLIRVYQETIRKFPGTERAARAGYRLGLTHLETGRTAEAEEALRKTVADHPQSPFAPQALGALADLYKRTGKAAERAVAIEQLLREYPRSPSSQRFWRERAMLLIKDRQYADAVPLLLHGIEADPTNDASLELRVRLGYVHIALDKPEEAIAYFEEVAADHPRSGFAPEALGVLLNLYGKVGEREKADAIRERLVADYPAAPQARQALRRAATALYAQNQREDAGRLFVRAILAEDDPSYLREACATLSEIATADEVRAHYQETWPTMRGADEPATGAEAYCALQQAFEHYARGETEQAQHQFRELARQAGLLDEGAEATIPLTVGAVAALYVANRERDASDCAEGLRIYDRILDRCGKAGKPFPSVRYHRAVALERSGREWEAETAWNELLTDEQTTSVTAEAGLALAKRRIRAGRLDAAMTALDEVVRRFRSSQKGAEAQLLRACVLKRQGRQDDAEVAIQSAAMAYAGRLHPLREARVQFAEVCLEVSDFTTARATLRKLLESAEEPADRASLRERYADASFLDGAFVEATRHYLEALETGYPTSPRARSVRAQALQALIRLEKDQRAELMPRALEALRKAEQAPGLDPETRDTIRAQQCLLRLRLNPTDMEEKRDVSRELTRLLGTATDRVLNELITAAHFLAYAHEFAGCERLLRAISEHPSAVQRTRERARLYIAYCYGKERRYADAHVLLTALIKDATCDEVRATALMEQGLYYYREGKPKEGIAPLMRARSMGIPDPLARAKIAHHLGNCHFAARQYLQAGRAYEQVLSLLAPTAPAGFGRYAFCRAAAEKGCRAYERAGDEASAKRCRQLCEATTARASQEGTPVEG